MSLHLHNPHSVLAVLDTRPRDVLEVRAAAAKTSPAWRDVLERARAAGVRVSDRPPPDAGRSSRRSGEADGGRTGLAEALVHERSPVSLDEVFGDVDPHASGGLWLALDQLQDPHNVGAIFRTAAFFGVRGIVLTRDRSAPLSATVYDVAAGGIEQVPFAVETNLQRSLKQAKDRGLWILGTSERAERDVREVPRDRPWLVVVGNEERGLRRLTLDTCDELCRITPRGPVGSLNVSVAAGVLLAALSW